MGATTFPDLAQRARTARRAISLRSAGVSERARALPPFPAPSLPNSRPALLALLRSLRHLRPLLSLSPAPSRIEHARASSKRTRASSSRPWTGSARVDCHRLTPPVGTPAWGRSPGRRGRPASSSDRSAGDDDPGLAAPTGEHRGVTGDGQCPPRPSDAAGPSLYFGRVRCSHPGARVRRRSHGESHGEHEEPPGRRPKPSVSMKGRLTLKTWAQGMKQWLLWLVGDGPLPGQQARTALGATLAVLVVMAVGASVRPPGRHPDISSAGEAKHAQLVRHPGHATSTRHHGSAAIRCDAGRHGARFRSTTPTTSTAPPRPTRGATVRTGGHQRQPGPPRARPAPSGPGPPRPPPRRPRPPPRRTAPPPWRGRVTAGPGPPRRRPRRVPRSSPTPRPRRRHRRRPAAPTPPTSGRVGHGSSRVTWSPPSSPGPVRSRATTSMWPRPLRGEGSDPGERRRHDPGAVLPRRQPQARHHLLLRGEGGQRRGRSAASAEVSSTPTAARTLPGGIAAP